jgi:hypothetical protein
MAKLERTSERRTRELKALAVEGVLVRFESPWKARVGTLYIWTHSGRWLNEESGHGGRLHGINMRELVAKRG